MRAKRTKRPCSECRRWYTPNPRVGARQRTCGAEECQKKRHRRVDGAWHERNHSYDRERRLSSRVAKATESKQAPVAGAKDHPIREIPWAVVQEELGVEAAEIAGEIVRIAVRCVQDEMRRQKTEIQREIGRLAPQRVQEPMAGGRASGAP